jgi:hypothetical protein
VKNPFVHAVTQKPANPFEGWPNPSAIKGAQPTRSSFSLSEKESQSRLENQKGGDHFYRPLIVCLGELAESAAKFAIDQQMKEENLSEPDCKVLFLGGSENNLFTQRSWSKRIAPQKQMSSKQEYLDWFIRNVRQISPNIQEEMNGTSQIILLTHLNDEESGAIGPILYLLRSFASTMNASILLLAAPERSGQTTNAVPGLQIVQNPLSSMREIIRYCYPGYYQQEKFPLELQQLATEGRLVDNEFWIRSQEGGKEADCEQMAEYLAILLCQNSKLFIDQQILNGMAQGFNLNERIGVPLINEARCASVYLPITEHKNFLQAYLAKELFVGAQGVFSMNENIAEQRTLLDVFIQYPEYYHPFYRWMFDDLPVGENGLWPIIVDGPGFIAQFKLRLMAFTNQQFLLNTPLATINGFLKLILARIQNRKRAFLLAEKRDLYDFSVEAEKVVTDFQALFNGWLNLLTPEEEPKDEYSYTPEINQVAHITLAQIIEDNLQKCLADLQKLSQKVYSIAAIDGNIAKDPSLPLRVQQKIKNDRLTEKIGWWVVDSAYDSSLRLFIGDKSFTSDQVDETFWSALDQLLTVATSEMMILDKAQFEAVLPKVIQKLSIVNDSGFHDDQVLSVAQNKMLLSYNESLVKNNGSQVFYSQLSDIQFFGNLPYTKVTAMVLEIGLRLDQIKNYSENLLEYFNDRQINHLEKGEDSARKIERDLMYLTESKRMLLPETVYCLHEEERTKLFFDSFLAGLIDSIPNRANPGKIWHLAPVGFYAGSDLFVASEKDRPLDSLFLAYQQFALNLLPRRIPNQNTSPFHQFNWERYQKTLWQEVEKANFQTTTKSALLPLFEAYEIVIQPNKLISNPDQCFAELFTALEAQMYFRDLDVAKLIYYFLTHHSK